MYRSPVLLCPCLDHLAHLWRVRIEDVYGPAETKRDSDFHADEIGDARVLSIQGVDVVWCRRRPPPGAPIVGQQIAIHVPARVVECWTERHDSRTNAAIGQMVANLA